MKVFTNRFILTYHVEEPCPCKVAAPLFEPGFKSLARGIMGRGEVVWQRPKRICESWKLRAMRPLTYLELSHSCTVRFRRSKSHGQKNTFKNEEELSVRISRRVDILTVVLEEL